MFHVARNRFIGAYIDNVMQGEMQPKPQPHTQQAPTPATATAHSHLQYDNADALGDTRGSPGILPVYDNEDVLGNAADTTGLLLPAYDYVENAVDTAAVVDGNGVQTDARYDNTAPIGSVIEIQRPRTCHYGNSRVPREPLSLSLSLAVSRCLSLSRSLSRALSLAVSPSLAVSRCLSLSPSRSLPLSLPLSPSCRACAHCGSRFGIEGLEREVLIAHL